MKILSVETKNIYNHRDNIFGAKNQNLDYDLYFHERQKELYKLRKDIKTVDMEMLSQKQYDKEIKYFFDNLKNVIRKD